MRRRLLVALAVGVTALAIAGLAIWLWTSTTNPGTPCDNGPGDGQAAGPTATTSGEAYWTDERMSSARGVNPTYTGC
ncbi:hypothetical protein GCM10029964_064850 [Kibdelosporangium lantanae]